MTNPLNDDLVKRLLIDSIEGDTLGKMGYRYKTERHEAATEITRLRAALTAANALIGRFAKADALAGVRALVAGWNGEGKPDGPNERHPPRLGATLPKTDCGAVYELDELLRTAAKLLAEIDAPTTDKE